MKPFLIKAIDQALQEGITWGFVRAYKHDTEPTEQQIKGAILEEIWNALHEWIDFEDQ